MSEYIEQVMTVILMFIATAILLLGTNCIIYWLYNIIVAVKFNMPHLSFWQVYGIVIMIRLIIPTMTSKIEVED